MTARNPAPAAYVGANDEKECDMQCPTDGTTLTMSERSGIEIDYCPQCRGVWLDRGELDKIIERSLTQQAPAAPAPPPQQGSYERERDQRRDYYDQRYQQQPYRKKKKESWLSEIFD
jgi:Zn-finger nucleic acid-binding protein